MKYVEKISLHTYPEQTSYLSSLPVVQQLWRSGGLELEQDIVFFVGENGSGKSTLLEAIAVALGFNAEGGSRNFRFSTCDTHAALHTYLRIARKGYFDDGFFLRAESFYNTASYLDALEDPDLLEHYGGVSLHAQSHGESFLSLVQNRFGGRGLYLLDEPESALSPMGQLKLMASMHQLQQQGAQFLIATHSPMLIAFPGAQVVELSADGICTVPYEKTELFMLTRQFLAAPERFFSQLFQQ